LNRIVRKFLDTLPAILLFVGVIVLWELATTVLGVREYLLPGPVTVLESMFSGEINWAGHIWVTGLAIFGAFIIAAVSGVLLGTMIAWSPVIGGALIWISILGLVLFGAVAVLSRVLAPWAEGREQ
jgi:NitT/TauT family transport system permease protein